MKFHLKDLINYRDIVVQCHDNPDADALASGFALVWYLKKQDIDARFVYGGKEAVQKSNLLKMIDDLQITVEHITELPEPELLVTVDCQYGEQCHKIRCRKSHCDRSSPGERGTAGSFGCAQ